MENLNIAFSTAACSYIEKMLEKNPGKVFRLSVKKTGCSGFSYLPLLVDAINTNDKPFNVEKLTVYIDAEYLTIFNGLKVDYIEEEKTGLKQKRLVFANPNEASRCGCGESFHLE